jgi:hypothetical protein
MKMPGFTADILVYETSEHFRRVSQRHANRLFNVQMAKLPGEGAPGVEGIKCGVCSSTGWQWCHNTLDGESIGEPFKRKCVPGGGGGGTGGSDGMSSTEKCALKFYLCTLGCQTAPWPANLICVGGCIAARLDCENPF